MLALLTIESGRGKEGVEAYNADGTTNATVKVEQREANFLLLRRLFHEEFELIQKKNGSGCT